MTAPIVQHLRRDLPHDVTGITDVVNVADTIAQARADRTFHAEGQLWERAAERKPARTVRDKIHRRTGGFSLPRMEDERGPLAIRIHYMRRFASGVIKGEGK